MQDIYSIRSSALLLENQTNNICPQPHILLSLPDLYQKNNQPKYSQFCLPLFFMLRKVSTDVLDKSRVEDCIAVEYQTKYEGILTYQNGRPVSLKQSMFIMRQKQKKLAQCYQIDKSSYFLKFTHTQTYTNSAQKLTSQQLNNRALQQIIIKLEENKVNLFTFLVQVGLISIQDKSLNRYSSILKVRKAKKKMQEILQLHSTPYKPDHKTSQNSPLSLSNKNQFFRSNISTESNYSQTNQTNERQCCLKQFLKNKSDYPEVSYQNNPITKVKNIEIISSEGDDEAYGGYFSVRNYQANLEIRTEDMKAQYEQIQQQNSSIQQPQPQNANMDIQQNPLHPSQQKQQQNDQQSQMSEETNRNLSLNTKLAIKVLNKQFQDNQKYMKKVQHQMNIVRQIRNNQYICQYYQPQNYPTLPSTQTQTHSHPQKTTIIMQKLLITLKQILTNNIHSNKFLIIQQLTRSIILLHESGIIHRDIKPGNIMFDAEGHLKLIDFSQSIQCWRKFGEQVDGHGQGLKVGFTLPYCPVQCSRVCEEGYANMRIDNWSVGMTVCQIIFGNLPVCYSKSLKNSIKDSWSASQFHRCLDLRTYNLNSELLLPIKILCLKLMEFESKDRLCLESFQSFLKFYESYVL